MGEWNFNRKQCVRALIKLGFILSVIRQGQHDKYNTPKQYLSPNTPPFIMIPRHNKLKIQHKIVKELEKMGGVELIEQFKNYL